MMSLSTVGSCFFRTVTIEGLVCRGACGAAWFWNPESAWKIYFKIISKRKISVLELWPQKYSKKVSKSFRKNPLWGAPSWVLDPESDRKSFQQGTKIQIRIPRWDTRLKVSLNKVDGIAHRSHKYEIVQSNFFFQSESEFFVRGMGWNFIHFIHCFILVGVCGSSDSLNLTKLIWMAKPVKDG